MSVDREAQDAQAGREVVVPDRRVPVGGAALQHLATPDVVHQDVEATVVRVDRAASAGDLDRIEVVDGDRDPGAAELGHERGGLLDRLGPVVVGPQRPGRARPAGAHDRRAGLTECSGDAASRAAGGAGHERDTAAQRVGIG